MEEKRCYGCMRLKSGSTVCEYCGYDENTSNEQHQISAGTILKEQYLIGKVLGQGGFGITYLGWDLYLDIPVAIKEYFPSGTVMREASVSMEVVSYSGDVGVRFRNNKERFMREAKMLARFSQVPEIVQVKNFFLANNTAYIVMEYVQGITLKQYVKEKGGKLSVEETLEYMKPVIDALRKVHKAGLVHRDISPDNIMMLPEGRMKLLDFGAVRDVGEAAVDKQLTKSTEAILKQGYAPIEQYQNRGSLGPWTDVYALCATMYYCMTGEVPPDAPERLLGKEEIDFKGEIPGLSDGQSAVLRKGMALRTGERIASMDELYENLYEAKEQGQAEVQDIKREESIGKIQEIEKDSSVFDKVSLQKEEVKESEKTKTLNKEVGLKIMTVAAALLALVIVTALFLPSDTQEQNKDDSGERAEDIQSDGEQNQNDNSDFAEGEEVVSGQCGEAVSWKLDRRTGKLILTGEGETYDFNGSWMQGEHAGEMKEDREYHPWADYREEITVAEIGDGITVLGENLFENCHNLKTVQFGNGLQEIRTQAFLTTAVESLTFPESMRIIHGYAFNYCRMLEMVEFSKSMERVEGSAFNCCNALKEVTFLNPNMENEVWWNEEKKVYITPFSDENTLKPVPDGMVVRGYENSVVQDFADICGCSFESMGEVPEPQLSGQCGDNMTWRVDLEEKTLYLSGTGETWFYYKSRGDLEGMIGDGIPKEWIHYGCPEWFVYRHVIENVVIGEGITDINDNICMEMYALKNVDFGTVKYVSYAFERSGVEEIILPKTVHTIGAHTFGGCKELKKVTILGGSGVIADGAFYECMNLEAIYFSKEAVLGNDIFESEISGKLVFYVYENSPAHAYAKERGIPYEIRRD